MPLVDSLAGTPVAVALRASPTLYLLINAAHILGIGLILGAILPLDLRLMGVLRHPPVPVIGPFLVRAAGVGVALALITGLALVAAKPADYLANGAFLTKLGLLAALAGLIAIQHANPGFRAALHGGPIPLSVRCVALLSSLLWLATLVAGRWIGFL